MGIAWGVRYRGVLQFSWTVELGLLNRDMKKVPFVWGLMITMVALTTYVTSWDDPPCWAASESSSQPGK